MNFEIDFTDYESALREAQDAISNLKNEAECLKCEMESWIENLDNVIDSCETIEII